MNNTYSLRLALAVLALASVLDTQAQTGGVFSEVLADAVHFQNSGGDTPLGFEAWNNTINFRYQNAYFGSLNAVTGALSINGRLTTGGGAALGWGVLDLINGDTSGGASDSAGIKAWNTIRLYSTCTGYTSNANYGIQFSPRDGSAVFKGNVGIGITAPAFKLDVADAARIRSFVQISGGTGLAWPFVGFNTAWDGNTGGGYRTTYTGFPAAIRASQDDGRLSFLTNGGSVAAGAAHSMSERMVVSQSGNVGIGTTTPCEPLEVASTGRIFIGDGGGAVRKGLLIDAVEDGTYIRLHPYNYGTAASMNLVISPFGAGNVGIGTTNPTNKLEVNGTIRGKEVIVETTGWSDYVFAPDYRLAPLSEVEAHIQAKGTLPGIPSAAEVAERGVSVGDMQAKLLAKMEEMTLHVIALSKKVDAQSAQLSAQATRIAQLETENAALRQP